MGCMMQGAGARAALTSMSPMVADVAGVDDLCRVFEQHFQLWIPNSVGVAHKAKVLAHH